MKVQKCNYRVIGVMSGTSLDGLDLALCEFAKTGDTWSFKILKGETINYSEILQAELRNAQTLNACEFVELHRRFGRFIGDEVLKFKKQDKEIDFVASHGHTVFHEPDKQITFQIGCGAAIAASSGLKTVYDFRTLDIALEGQGAPLVPIGDRLLFGNHDACVNLGGFANISYQINQKRIAFDICPVNIILNEIVNNEFGLPFDKDGELGASGELNEVLFKELNGIPFYGVDSPKSLAREWVENTFMPIIKGYGKISKKDLLTTCYHHFAIQIASVLNRNELKQVLFTGGGTFNRFLIRLILEYTNSNIIIPPKEVINFKEALIFAFLGVLRVEEQVNCLSSVTGARKDNVGGSIYMP